SVSTVLFMSVFISMFDILLVDYLYISFFHSFIVIFVFFFKCSGGHRDLHSFPTRRSSDLGWNFAIVTDETGGVSTGNRDSQWRRDRKSTRLNSSHVSISYAVFCLKKKMKDEMVMSKVLRSTERTS